VAVVVRSSSVSTQTQANPSIPVAKPTGTAVGDVLYLMVSSDDGTPATPTGFTQIFTGDGVGGSGPIHTRIYRRVIDGTEGTTFSVTCSVTCDASLVAVAVTGGVTSGEVFGAYTENTGGSLTTSLPAGSVTPTAAGSLLLAIFTARNSVATSTTPPAGMTELQDDNEDWISLSVSAQTGVAASATGTKTATASAASIYGNVLMAIAPGAVNGSGTVALTGAGSLTIAGSGNPDGSGQGDLIGAGSLTIAGSGTAPTDGSGTVALTGAGSATLSGSGTIPGSGTVALTGAGSATLSGSGSSAVPGAMEVWRTALSNRNAAPATALFIGDSVTEGQGASARANRWIDVLRGNLRADLPTVGTTGGYGYVPTWYAVYAPDSPWPTSHRSTTGTVTDLQQNPGDTNDKNLGLRHSSLAAGATVSFTVTGTSADVWWQQGYGSFTVQVDGGTATTVNTAGGTQGYPARTTISLGASGSHTVLITATTAVRVAGLMVYDGDESKGIRFMDAGHVGFFSDSYLGAGMQQAWALAAPDLVVIELGANDCIYNHFLPAGTKANVVSLIGQIRAAVGKPVSIAVVIFNGAISSSSGQPWTAYRTALASIATDDPTVQVIDWGTISATASDGAHPNNTGYLQIANAMRAALAQPSGGTLALAGSGELALAGATSTTGTLTFTGSGTAAFTGNVGGALDLAGDGVLALAGAGTVPGSGSITLSGSGSITSLTGVGVRFGAGTVAFAGNGVVDLAQAGVFVGKGSLLLQGIGTTQPAYPWVPDPGTVWSAFARGSNYALTAALPLLDGTVVLTHMGLDKATVTTTYTSDNWAAVAPGAGITLWRAGRQVFSGPIQSRTLTWDPDNNSAQIKLEAVGDEVVLTDRLAMPDPLRAGDDQTVNDYWTFTGAASTAMRQLISDQAGATCATSRRVSGLVLGADPAVGLSQTWTGLFDNVMDLLTSIATTSGANLGVRVSSSTGALTASVVAPRDLSASVIFSADLSNVGATTFTETAPTVTDALVAGQGDLHLRTRKLAETADTGSTRWGRQVWSYVDRRDTNDAAKLTQAGTDALTKGQATVSLTLTLLDSDAARYGTDWDLGDKVTVYVGLPGESKVAVVSEVIREITLQINGDGSERIQPAIGSVAARTYLPTPTQRAVTAATQRVNALIRNK
jgi:lysophospholipase L1-like esterase